VLFTLASYVYERDKDKALEQMKTAFDPSLVFAPADMDLYGGALIAKGRYDEAEQVYNKLVSDYPNPPGVVPGKAPVAVQEAQAVALFGLGKVLQEQKKTAEAAVKFDLLNKLYPWSPKVLEANYGIAQSLVEKKEYEKATPLLVAIIGARTATADLRANAMLLVARMAEQKNEINVAVDNYAKIAMFYQGVPAPAAEGLYKAAELILTKQLATIPDEKKRAAQKAKAAKYIKDLQSNYASSPFAEKAKSLMGQLGG
jgi:tetratricopeptide (TPR) repeat protein